jgi:thymidylate kinase
MICISRKMIPATSRVNDPTFTAIHELRSIAACSYKQTGVPFPATHLKLDFKNPGLAQTRTTAEVLRSCGYRAISARQIGDEVSVVFARCTEGRLQSIAVPMPLTAAADALLRGPRGLFLAIFGPDGVGKSSVVSATISALGPFFEHQRTACWRPQILSSRIAKEPHKFKLPHDVSMHGPVLSMLKLTGTFFDFFLDHATLTRNQLRGSSFIAWDRYLHDLTVDRRRYRYRGPAWYADFLLRSLPVPKHFMGIVLDAEAEIILDRKRELPFDEIQRQRAAYRRLAASLPSTYIVRNEGELGSCLEQVLSLVIKRMASGFEPIAGELLDLPQSELSRAHLERA